MQLEFGVLRLQVIDFTVTIESLGTLTPQKEEQKKKEKKKKKALLEKDKMLVINIFSFSLNDSQSILCYDHSTEDCVVMNLNAFAYHHLNVPQLIGFVFR